MPQFRTLASGLQPIGSYQLILELGRGGMGVVHLARTVGIGGFERLVVIKRLLPHLLREEEAVQRFLAEARNGACVRHTNVVGIHQVGQDDEGYFLVLDYVEGAGLDEIVQRTVLRRRKLPVPIALRIALDACAGLSAVHEARAPNGRSLGMLHRDVSLENLIVGCDGTTRLADFGISRSVVRSIETSHDHLLGKLLYLAPEYVHRRPVGPTLDVYALGVTLWMTLNGRDPWPEASEPKLMQMICEDGLPPLGAEFPRGVAALVAQACRRDPAERFASAAGMARAIESVAAECGGLATQGDVSDFVHTLMGVDLVRRRQRVADRVATIEEKTSPTHTSMPPPPRPPKSTSFALPMRWRPRRVAWITAGTVAAALALWLAATREPQREPSGAAPARVREPAAITEAREPSRRSAAKVLSAPQVAPTTTAGELPKAPAKVVVAAAKVAVEAPPRASSASERPSPRSRPGRARAGHAGTPTSAGKDATREAPTYPAELEVPPEWLEP